MLLEEFGVKADTLSAPGYRSVLLKSTWDVCVAGGGGGWGRGEVCVPHTHKDEDTVVLFAI